MGNGDGEWLFETYPSWKKSFLFWCWLFSLGKNVSNETIGICSLPFCTLYLKFQTLFLNIDARKKNRLDATLLTVSIYNLLILLKLTPTSQKPKYYLILYMLSINVFSEKGIVSGNRNTESSFTVWEPAIYYGHFLVTLNII